MIVRQLMSRSVRPALFLSFLCISTSCAFAAEGGKLPPSLCPPINPNADFLTNFNTPCYALPLYSGNGANQSGDANAIYDNMYYAVNSNYELVLIGTYPNARFLSATVYDSHMAITSSVIDQNILPLNSSMANPFLVGAAYAPNQQYGITIGMGGSLTATPSPGCSASDTTIDQNFLDASQIHQGLTWNNDPAVFLPPYNFPVQHQTGANSSGILMVRKYLALAGSSYPEAVIVRSVATGCAIPQQKAVALHILFPPESPGWSMLSQQQITYHQDYSNGVENLECYRADPNNVKQWFRAVDYVPLANLGTSLDVNLTATDLAPLENGSEFIRLRFPAPTTPNTPCASGCSLTGNENLRYYSVSFLGASNGYGKVTLTSVADNAFLQDPNGNVTLLINVGAGVQQPAIATTANYYNYLDLTTIPNYTTLSRIELRNILPNATFGCSIANIPIATMEYNSVGGFMGQYVPTIDFPTGAQLPAPALPPPTRQNTCANVPGLPVACGPADPELFPPQ